MEPVQRVPRYTLLWSSESQSGKTPLISSHDQVLSDSLGAAISTCRSDRHCLQDCQMRAKRAHHPSDRAILLGKKRGRVPSKCTHSLESGAEIRRICSIITEHSSTLSTLMSLTIVQTTLRPLRLYHPSLRPALPPLRTLAVCTAPCSYLTTNSWSSSANRRPSRAVK